MNSLLSSLEWQNPLIAVDWSGGWRLLGESARAENPFFSGVSRKKLVGAVPPGKRPARTKINLYYNSRLLILDLEF